MSSLVKVLGWFPHSPTEWIKFIIVAVLLWLLMVAAISELRHHGRDDLDCDDSGRAAI